MQGFLPCVPWKTISCAYSTVWSTYKVFTHIKKTVSPEKLKCHCIIAFY